jgi:hypothetical protein
MIKAAFGSKAASWRQCMCTHCAIAANEAHSSLQPAGTRQHWAAAAAGSGPLLRAAHTQRLELAVPVTCGALPSPAQGANATQRAGCQLPHQRRTAGVCAACAARRRASCSCGSPACCPHHIPLCSECSAAGCCSQRCRAALARPGRAVAAFSLRAVTPAQKNLNAAVSGVFQPAHALHAS